MAIKEFRDEFAFLSNSYPSLVEYRGITFKTAEHAFQYQKIRPNTDVTEYWQEEILNAAVPSIARSYGAKCPSIKNWEDDKVDIMRYIVKSKFDQHPDLRFKLSATKNEKLINGNYIGDEFWGVSLHSNKGLNHLGQILMDLRASYE